MQVTNNRVLHLLLCSEEREFVQAFAYFVHTHPDWCRSLKVTSFAATEQLERYVSGKPLWDVCLCTPQFLPVIEKVGGQQDCLLLVGERIVNASSNGSGNESGQPRRLYAYQPLPALLEEVQKHAHTAESLHRHRLSEHTASGRTIAVYSAAGGTGKTTLALTLAKVWGRTRKAVYLNMEDMPSMPLFGTDDPLAEWLYIVRSRESNSSEAGSSLAEEALRRAIGRLQEGACDWVKPLRHPEDYAEFGGNELDQLRRMLLDNLQYEVVIIDLSSAWHKHAQDALSQADTVICLVDGSTGCREKTAHLLERMQLRKERRPEKAWLFINGKATDLQSIDEPDERLPYRVHTALPYVPAWKCNRGRLLQDQSVYTQAVCKVIESLEERRSITHAGDPSEEARLSVFRGTRMGLA